MDIVRFTNPTHPLKMEQGQVINGLKSKMWIERYVEAGEFKFTAAADSGMREKLPIGSFITHIDTGEIMIVENHEVTDQKDKDSDIIVSGRGFETIFEGRMVGSNKAFPTSTGSQDFVLTSDFIVDQIIYLIEHHILASELVDDNDQLLYIDIVSSLMGIPEGVDRSIKRQDLYSALLELLKSEGLGIKVSRMYHWPSFAYPPYPADGTTALEIHKGIDRSQQVIFSQDTGEIESAEYLWSSRKRKNACLITGRWVETRVVGVETGPDRRWMTIDASDIDNHFEAAPGGVDLDNVVAAMQLRGRQALGALNDIALTKVEMAKESTRAIYRQDFNVGDIVTILGAYNEATTMRISEYVEIEDETGFSRYPTLTEVI